MYSIRMTLRTRTYMPKIKHMSIAQRTNRTFRVRLNASRLIWQFIYLGNTIMQLNKIPTTVVTGFLGSGKTTLLSNIIKQAEQQMLFVSVIFSMMLILSKKLLMQQKHNQNVFLLVWINFQNWIRLRFLL